MIDWLIRGATLIDAQGEIVADLAVADGKIAAIGHHLPGPARQTFDGAGLHVFPGLIDPHVHFNEPGRADWEGVETGSRALAAGGVTSFFDMPLNSDPPVTTVAAFDAKRAVMTAKSVVNAYLWGGLIPGNLDQLDALHRRGAIGFKAFMCDSGIAEFPAADDYTLVEGMRRIARLGSILAVHAENDALTRGLAAEARALGRVAAHDYLATRPEIAESEAIQRAIYFAGQAGARLHIVHVSTGLEVALIHQAGLAGADVSCETCPHYLLFTADDLPALGAAGKCAPPLRAAHHVESLWARLADGTLPMIASDHSPAPPAMKTGDDWLRIWGGIAGCQTTLPSLLTHGHHARGLPLTRIAAVTSFNIAERFGLANKGRLRVGADADLALVDVDAETTLRPDDLFYRHKISPYLGMNFKGRVVRTLVGGRTVYADGQIVG